ncbi:MAG: ribonuclease Y [Clostridia bacterium]|nr:ribonuclease Y [Clostridia bacterium]
MRGLGKSFLFLADNSSSTPTWAIVLIVVFAVLIVAGAVLGYFFGYFRLKNKFEKEYGELKTLQDRMVAEATAEGKKIKKEALLEAKEQELKARNEFEKETKEKRAELSKLEQRLNQREDTLGKKEDSLSKREDNLNKKNESVEAQRRDLAAKEAKVKETQEILSHQHELMLEEIEKVSKLTQEEARKLLTEEILDETRRDVAVQVRNIEQQAKDDAEAEAKKIIALAIQRCAGDQASEMTVSVIPIPSDDMKARIIGREGRNIRAIENATGVELIVDDTPEVVVASGFDPVRREIARLSLEKLISDGRIHPARIEETVEKVKKELDVEIKQAGENAMFEVGIYGIHPELIKLLGRLKYRTSYGQNVYKHSIEVAKLAGLMAQELGVDVNLAKRAGLLHDIGKAIDFEHEGTHVQLGADVARKYRENKFVVNAIASHHGDEEPLTIEAELVAAADSISGGRPGARRDTGANYVTRLEKLESIAMEFAGVERSYAIQAGREVRVIVKPEVIDDAQALFLAKDIAKKIESELEYPGQIKVNVIREARVVEIAK